MNLTMRKKKKKQAPVVGMFTTDEKNTAVLFISPEEAVTVKVCIKCGHLPNITRSNQKGIIHCSRCEREIVSERYVVAVQRWNAKN